MEFKFEVSIIRMMNKKYLNWISYIFLLIISYIVIFRTDKEELKNLLLEVGFINFILIIIIASSYLFFSSLKWCLIMKNFQVTKFKDSLSIKNECVAKISLSEFEEKKITI